MAKKTTLGFVFGYTVWTGAGKLHCVEEQFFLDKGKPLTITIPSKHVAGLIPETLYVKELFDDEEGID
jgi:hypothetical protein